MENFERIPGHPPPDLPRNPVLEPNEDWVVDEEGASPIDAREQDPPKPKLN